MSVKTWDIETTIRTSFKRKANPFDPNNWTVMHGFKEKGKDECTVFYYGMSRPPEGWLRPVLQGTKLLVGFNIKFDLLHALQDEDNLDAWMEWVAGGGLVWDCQLAEYLLNGMGQKDHMLSLDEVAPRYGGNLKVDEVKALWAAGVSTEEIDPELLERYLVGGKDETGEYQLGDLGNTERIALAQLDRARAAKQVNSLMLNMGALLFTVEAERNGMFIDKPLGLTLAAELAAEVDRVSALLVHYLPTELPFDFKWTSRFHKSALIFGGTVNYDSYEWMLEDGSYMQADLWQEQGCPRRQYVKKEEQHAVLESGKTMSLLMWEHLQQYPDGTDTEPVRYAGGKNKGEVKTKKVKVDDVDKPKGRACKAPYTFEGYTTPSREWATTEPGVYSTSSEVIEALGKRDIPFLKLLSELQAMTKDLGTYFIIVDEETGAEKGMLSLVDARGLIHHKLNMTSTVTARLSSSDPNLQNIPKGNKSKVKLVFVSRFAGGKIIQSDFSSLEVYVQAVLTQCQQLILDLRAGLDMHCVRVSQKEGRPYEEVLLLCKGDESKGVEPVKEWDTKRTKAKQFSFQRAYGAGANKIAESTGMTVGEVEALVVAENERYPEIEAYYEGVTEKIKQSRKPGAAAVPHPTVRGILCHLGRGFYRTPDGKLYSYMEQPSPDYLVKRGTYTSFSPTEIKNYVVQGTGGEWAKAAMWLAVREFYRVRNFAQQALLVNQVHDAVYVDAHESVAQEAAALLHACMEAASEYMEYLFKWPIPVAVPSDTTWGDSMMDEHRVPDVRALSAPLRADIRVRYMRNIIPTFERE